MKLIDIQRKIHMGYYRQAAKTYLSIAKGAVYFCLSLAALAVALLASAGAVFVTHADKHLDATLAHVDAVIDQTQKTVVIYAKLGNDARLAVDNINKGAIDQRFWFEKAMPPLLVQAQGVLSNVQTATADLHPLLTEATARTHDLKPIEANAAALIADVDATAKNPLITESLVNLEAASSSLERTSAQGFEAMTAVKHTVVDVQGQVHAMTHPTPLVTAANWTLKVIHAIGGWF